jgi:cation diffusion facilitator CzcD-associated flavoprotein CzcO
LDAKPGGTWVYTPKTESDLNFGDPGRIQVHSSLYASLRTNLPREVMGYRDYPFVDTGKADRDPRRFPGHAEVLEYLNDFTAEFGLSELVRFETKVCHVESTGSGKWEVTSKKRGESLVDEIYDAVVICNGHYSEPRIAQIHGIDSWPGIQMHSHNYRVPDPFQDKVVVLIGSSASAVDISREIAKVAKQVCIASRSYTEDVSINVPGFNNLYLHSMVQVSFPFP